MMDNVHSDSKKPLKNSACPEFMTVNIIEYDFNLSTSEVDKVWDKLQRRETFTKGQIPPYRVEFESGKEDGSFEPGEKNIHHGPFLSVHGEIGEISNTYRSLYYYFGSYVLSFRLARPWLLEFSRTENGIKMKLHSYIHRYFVSLWRLGNAIFWKQFGITFLFK